MTIHATPLQPARLQSLIQRADHPSVAQMLGDLSASAVAGLLTSLTAGEAASALKTLPRARQISAFLALPPDWRFTLARTLDRASLINLIASMSSEARDQLLQQFDDALDVATDVPAQEAARDFRGQGGITQVFGSVRDASTFSLYRARVVWLVLLVFGNLFSGAGIAVFQETLEATIALVFFLPLLVDSGGNAGSQAATLMVRALSTRDVRLSDWGRLAGRDFLVSLGLGLTMAFAVSLPGFYRGGAELALVVALSMIIIVVFASLIGLSIPFLLMRFKRDPTVASAPLITSIVDAVGVLIYFSIATAILHPSAVAPA
ncbi:Magnesium transporter MgtE [Pandoraea terrae]|uniref:Magnesium transporter MgtE n=1 Tax=Pandoraea terrae TaxID=1537710 RepID=A0A5E4ZH98_9BURK|nr:magnesium transporter [Pandoraea terrae]VVE59553.1 Magnesium transporter MgtE [Pandoraea terrae]